METSRKIIIKMPVRSNGSEQMSLDIDPKWTIADLKQHLTGIVSGNPRVEDQKLIFSGRILENDSRLEICFDKTQLDQIPVLHLVCKPANLNVSSQNATENDGLRRRNVGGNGDATSANFQSFPSNSNAFYPTYDPRMTPQLYHAYYQQYLAAFGSAYYQLPPAFHPHFHTPVNVHNHPQAFPTPMPQIQNQRDLPQGPEVAHNGGNGFVMNAPGGAVIEDDMENQRDIMDWAYSTIRLALLLFLVFLSSSTSRFLCLFGIVAFFFGFNTYRWLKRIRQRPARQNQEPANPNPEPAAAEDENPIPQPTVEQNPSPQVTVEENPDGAEQQNGVLSTVLNVLTGLVTSLVPENVPHLAEVN